MCEKNINMHLDFVWGKKTLNTVHFLLWEA